MNNLFFIFICLTLQGCISFYPTGSLGTPNALLTEPFSASVMVDQVVVSDPRINANAQLTFGSHLTDRIRQYIQDGHYFEQVIAFPAKMGNEDVLLKFNFTSLYAKRRPHPGYFPGALLTLTVWIGVNGPIYVDSYDIAGELTIENAQSSVLAKSTRAVAYKENVGLWDENYILYRGQKNEPLTQLVEGLLEDAFAQLKAHEEKEQ